MIINTYNGKSCVHNAEIADILYHEMEGMDETEISKEHLWVFSFDAGQKIMRLDLVAVGTDISCIADIKQILRPPLLCCAHSIAVAHNHPIGDTTPSRTDIKSCGMQMMSSRLMGIEYCTNMIIGTKREHGYKEVKINRRAIEMMATGDNKEENPNN